MALDLKAKALGQLCAHLIGNTLIKINDDATGGTDKVMVAPFGTNVCGAILPNVDWAHNVELGEQLQCAIDCGTTNGGVDRLRPPQDLGGFQMFTFLFDHLEHSLTSWRNFITGIT